MDRWDFSNLEEKINSSVNDAFNAIDDIVIRAEEFKDSILNGRVKNNIINNTMSFNERINNIKKEQYEKVNKIKNDNKQAVNKIKYSLKKDKETNTYFVKRAPGSISGILFIILGSFLTFIFGVSIIAYSLVTSFKIVSSISNIISLGILVTLFGISIGTIFKGLNLRKRVKRFKEYIKCLNGHEYGSIENFAKSIGKKKKFVIKDLKKMIDLGMFKEANIDEEENYLMLGNEVYENYLMSQRSFEKRKADEIKRKEEADDPKKAQLLETVDICRKYIEEIKESNNSITDSNFSNKLDRLQKVVGEILNCIEKNPEKLSEVNKFTNHYLPITLKLVMSYKELSTQAVQGENIKKAKNEIENSIDVINKAFEKLLDDLFEDMAMDISTDISVLKTLFTQDGLTKKDFEK